MSDILFTLKPDQIRQNQEIKGTVSVSYPGRYDGVVINAQISDSNEHVTYLSYSGKKISRNVSRLFVPRDAMRRDVAEFTAAIRFAPEKEHEVKFRASIIEQHKEIGSDIIFVKYVTG